MAQGSLPTLRIRFHTASLARSDPNQRGPRVLLARQRNGHPVGRAHDAFGEARGVNRDGASRDVDVAQHEMAVGISVLLTEHNIFLSLDTLSFFLSLPTTEENGTAEHATPGRIRLPSRFRRVSPRIDAMSAPRWERPASVGPFQLYR